MDIAITAIGTATPPFKRSQQEIVELLSSALALKPSEKRLVNAIYKAAGISHRYSVLSDGVCVAEPVTFFPKSADLPLPTTAARMQIYKQQALPLALAAIENCLATQTSATFSKITHLITVSCTGMYAPGIDIEIVQTLGLNPSTKRTCINFMGCYGAFNAIKVADSICRADSDALVLVVCVELCSIHFQHVMKKDNIISNAIFADGAGALLISANPSQERYLLLQQFYCELLPQTQREMAWMIADSGFDIVLSSYVPEIIETGIAQFVAKLLRCYSLLASDIDFFAIHPGGIKILEACERALQLEKSSNQHAYRVLNDFGNMSSATIVFVLKELFLALGQQDHQKNVFSCAFGPGLTLESMLLKVHCAH